MKKGRIGVALGLIGILANCNTSDKPKDYISMVQAQNDTWGEFRTVGQVPVLDYTVIEGDIPIRLIYRELEGSLDFSKPADGTNILSTSKSAYDVETSLRESIKMLYEDAPPDMVKIRKYGNNDPGVPFNDFLTVTDILAVLNGDRRSNTWQPDEYYLTPGEQVLVPDFNRDGKINGVPGTQKGYLNFACWRDDEGIVGKELKYIPPD